MRWVVASLGLAALALVLYLAWPARGEVIREGDPRWVPSHPDPRGGRRIKLGECGQNHGPTSYNWHRIRCPGEDS